MIFRRRNSNKEAAQDAKVQESQQLLMNSTIETAFLAQEVTRAMQKRMEDAVDQFVATARIMNDGLLICANDGTIIAFNPSAQILFGLPDIPTVKAQDLFESNHGERIEAEDLWTLGRAKKRVVSGKKGNKLFPTHIRVSTLDRSDGTTVSLLVVQDLTMIETSFKTTSHAYAVISENEVIAVNMVAARIFGYEADEMLGKPSTIIVGSKHKSGQHLDITFELSTVLWEGKSAMLVTIRQFSTICPTCGQPSKTVR